MQAFSHHINMHIIVIMYNIQISLCDIKLGVYIYFKYGSPVLKRTNHSVGSDIHRSIRPPPLLSRSSHSKIHPDGTMVIGAMLYTFVVERAALDRLRVAGAATRRTVVRGVRDATSAVHTCSKNHKTRQRGVR